MSQSKMIAFGGIFAAVALTVMCLGGLIPVATYICPMFCCLIQSMVLRRCGKRVGWAWFFAVAILSLLLAPDKEAACVFLFLGFYPMVKQKIDRYRLRFLWKLIFFNLMIGILYYLLLSVIGMPELIRDFQDMHGILLWLMILMGNITFLLMDFLLDRWKVLYRG